MATRSIFNLPSPIFTTFGTDVAIAILVTLPLTGCIPNIITEYRIDIQQGNVITQKMVSKLKPGMTHKEVRALLGTPTLTDVFHADRWDYPYTLQDGSTQEVKRRLFSVFFDKSGRLSSVSGDVKTKRVAPEPVLKTPAPAPVSDLTNEPASSEQ